MDTTTSFEELFGRLEAIITEMEKGEMPLEDNLKLFEEGVTVSEMLHNQLEKAEQRITELTAKLDQKEQ